MFGSDQNTSSQFGSDQNTSQSGSDQNTSQCDSDQNTSQCGSDQNTSQSAAEICSLLHSALFVTCTLNPLSIDMKVSCKHSVLTSRMAPLEGQTLKVVYGCHG